MPSPKKILAPGVVVNSLIVEAQVGVDTWRLRCVCGNHVEYSRRGALQADSCGCLRRQKLTIAARARRTKEKEEEEAPPSYWSKKPCPKCKGLMAADRYFACHSCFLLPSEHWMGTISYYDGAHEF